VTTWAGFTGYEKKTKSDTHKNKIDEINTKVHPCLDIYIFIHIQK